MTETLPGWLTNRYSVLWKEYKDSQFSFKEAQQILGETNPKTLSVVLSDLKRHGWLKAKLDPKDSRKRLYQLKPPQVAVEEIAIEYLKVKGDG